LATAIFPLLDVVEIGHSRRSLMSPWLDLLFLDTSCSFIWRDTETPLRRRGYSRARRPDQPQLVEEPRDAAVGDRVAVAARLVGERAGEIALV